MDSLTAYIKTIGMTYGLNIIYALLIFIIGRRIARFLSRLAVKALEKTSADLTLKKFMSGLIYYILLAAVVIAAMNKLGIQTTSIVAVLATAGLAVGLALKDSLSNFAAGVMIIIFKPFVIGNYVECAGTAGSIDEIGIFTVKLKTPDSKFVIVPNSSVINGTITNYSASPTRRVDIPVGVSYDADIRKVKEVLKGIIDSTETVLRDPEPVVVMTSLGDSSVNFAIRAWANTADYWPTYNSMLEQVKLRLDEEGIGIPYPQMDVHIKKED